MFQSTPTPKGRQRITFGTAGSLLAGALLEPIVLRAKSGLDRKIEQILRDKFRAGMHKYSFEENSEFTSRLVIWAKANPNVELSVPKGISSTAKVRRIRESYDYELHLTNFVVSESLDEEAFFTFWYKGVQFDVTYGEMSSGRVSDRQEKLKRNLIIQAPLSQAELLDEVVEAVVTYQPEKRPSSVKITSQWGDWISMPERDMRSLRSVILPKDKKTNIVADMEQFFSSRSEYTELGLPWRRGYLFEGPPGGGKTSLLQALAGHFNIDLYMVSLNSFENDIKFHAAMSGIPTRSIVVFEDVDAFRGTGQRTDSNPASETKVSLAGLLNVIDGMMAPNGAVIVLTTNYPEKLDSALTRPGRIDYRLHFGPITQAELDDFVALYYPNQSERPQLSNPNVMPAEIVDILKKRQPYEVVRPELEQLVGTSVGALNV